MTERAFPVIILTGLSGSGKSSGLKVFEDLGFFCVDGLPVSLAPILIRLFEGQADTRSRGLALGMDVRQEDLDREWGKALGQIKSQGVGIQIVFIEADTREIIRRYATTRRPHPLEKQDVGLERAVILEQDRMSPIREAADLIIDTTNFSIHDLRRTLQEKWSFLEGKSGLLKVHVISFGFKYGPPAEADLISTCVFCPIPILSISSGPCPERTRRSGSMSLTGSREKPSWPAWRISCFTCFPSTYGKDVIDWPWPWAAQAAGIVPWPWPRLFLTDS
jgi:UPF0042 nucleotide-binding protein